MKFLRFHWVGVCLVVLAGCASAPEPNAAAAAATPREVRCQVTGSNLPKRDCVGDVTVLPPSAADNVLPSLPRK
jgi:hypothetical protein